MIRRYLAASLLAFAFASQLLTPALWPTLLALAGVALWCCAVAVRRVCR